MIALLLPSLQIARSGVRRSQCSSNLRQLGIALHNYHTALGSFPPGLTYGSNVDLSKFEEGQFAQIGFYNNAFTLMLPYIERLPLRTYAKRFDTHRPLSRQSPVFAGATIPDLVCPDNSNKVNPLQNAYFDEHLRKMEHWVGHPVTIGPALGLTDYLLCKGVSDGFCLTPGFVRSWEEINRRRSPGGVANNERGVFDLSIPFEINKSHGSFVCTISMIADGTSNTFAIGEGAQGPDWQICTRGRGAKNAPCVPLCWDGRGPPKPCGDPPTGEQLPIYQFWATGPNVTPGADGGLDMGSVLGCTLEPLNKNPVTHTLIRTEPEALSNCRASIDWDGNGPVNRNTPPGVDRVSNFRSVHPGGGNFLFADGNVKYLTDDIDMHSYRAMSSIQGSETPPLPLH